MNIMWNDTPEKKKFRDEALPKEPLTHSILVPAIKELLNDALLQTLRAEIEVYKAYPKNNATPDMSRFNPTNHKTCFMGLGFQQTNSDWNDADLAYYRKAVGTINHKEWGDCTLLEIWGADHFVKYPDMVKGVFKYCFGLRKTLPVLFFESLPFIITEATGITQPDEDDKEVAKAQFLIECNGVRVLTFGQEAYQSYEELSPEIQQEFERIWKSKLKRGKRSD